MRQLAKCPAVQRLQDPEFDRLRADLLRYPRLNGYYLCEMVSLAALRAKGLDEEAVLDRVFQHFDDHPWPEDRSTDERWDPDYRREPDVAQALAVDALVGGPAVGNIHPTMDRAAAVHIVERFVSLFAVECRFYCGMGLGNRDFAFQHGMVIVDQQRAGILWVVE